MDLAVDAPVEANVAKPHDITNSLLYLNGVSVTFDGFRAILLECNAGFRDPQSCRGACVRLLGTTSSNSPPACSPCNATGTLQPLSVVHWPLHFSSA